MSLAGIEGEETFGSQQGWVGGFRQPFTSTVIMFPKRVKKPARLNALPLRRKSYWFRTTNWPFGCSCSEEQILLVQDSQTGLLETEVMPRHYHHDMN